MEQLAKRLIENYDNVTREVHFAIKHHPKQLADAVVDYIMSLGRLTDAQNRNLLKLLERKDLPLLIKCDCVREVTKGPAKGRILSKKLALQMAQALDQIDERDGKRQEALKRIRFITEVDDLPEFLSHKDPEVVEAAKERMAYLLDPPDEGALAALEQEEREKRQHLVTAAVKLQEVAIYCLSEKKTRMLEHAEDLLAASRATSREEVFKKYDYYYKRGG